MTNHLPRFLRLSEMASCFISVLASSFIKLATKSGVLWSGFSREDFRQQAGSYERRVGLNKLNRVP